MNILIAVTTGDRYQADAIPCGCGVPKCQVKRILLAMLLLASTGWGQATLVNYCTKNNGGSSTTSLSCGDDFTHLTLQNPSFLTAFEAGDSITPSTVSDTASNTFTLEHSGSSIGSFDAQNGATGSDTPTGTVTMSGSHYWTLFAAQFSGVKTGVAFDTACEGTQPSGGSTDVTYCTMTLAQSNELVLIANTRSCIPTGSIQIADNNGNRLCYINVRSPGTFTCSGDQYAFSLTGQVCAAWLTNGSGVPPPPPTTEYVRGIWVFDQGTPPPPPSTPLAVTSVSPFPSAVVSSSYQIQLQATGGTLPYIWALFSGTLPTGLTLDAATGTLSGIPTIAGTSSFTVQVTDSVAITATKAFSLTVAAASHWMSLAWTPSSGATSYNVKRSTFNVGPYTTIATGVTATSYTDGNVTSGITYYYVVSAVNSAGESANSTQAIATIP